jgi:DNA topoisomerase-1
LQYVYSKKFVSKQAAEKFERINALDDKMREINKQVAAALKKKSEEAACLRLIMATGIRPGSDKDTQAAKKAFGATTLQGQHVVVKGGKVSLRFVGKKGVDLDIPVTDPKLAQELIKRKAAAGKNGKLFATNSGKLSQFTHSLDGGGFKTKDMRTYLGTTLAQNLVEKKPIPRTEKEYRAAVRDVARVVSQQLGNTPTVALQSYIAPVSFAGWRQALDNRG